MLVTFRPHPVLARLGLLAALIATAAGAVAAPVALMVTDPAAVIASPLRSADDRAADAGRHPAELLLFSGVKPGMRVLDVASGGGYTAQLFALAVGPAGQVLAQVSRPSSRLAARLAAQPQPNFTVLERPLEDLYPADLPRVDIVTLVLSYHDIAYSPIDRSKMNKAMFDALKPGGVLVLIDHAAKAGTGTADSKTLHRIDEQLVRAELQAAGFRLEAEGDFMRVPADPREQAFYDMKTPADRFVLRFIKPR